MKTTITWTDSAIPKVIDNTKEYFELRHGFLVLGVFSGATSKSEKIIPAHRVKEILTTY